jgi:hypothetical protein
VLEHRGTKTPENPTGTAKTITLPNGKTYAPSDHFCDGYVPELGKVVADPGAKCLGEESHLQSWVYGDEGTLTRSCATARRRRQQQPHPGRVRRRRDAVPRRAPRRQGDPPVAPAHAALVQGPEQPRLPAQRRPVHRPGEGYRMELEGGAGGTQRTAGDSIFHCHLYPHFAQGMWGHLRIFDKLRNGSQKYADGTPITALRELPNRSGQTALRPRPSPASRCSSRATSPSAPTGAARRGEGRLRADPPSR